MEVKKDKKNILYLLIGLLTLIVTTTGATFAYLTATDSVEDAMTGNMASITFSLSVKKMTTVDDDLNRGLIPMSNSMVESAVSNASVGAKGICLDDNGNAVCQIYKISVANTGTAAMLLDGYVTLEGGSGTASDLPNYEYTNGTDLTKIVPYDVNYYKTSGSGTVFNPVTAKNNTTMRWAQVFCNETSEVVSNCTTVGKTTTTASKSTNGLANGITSNWTAVENTKTGVDTETINGITVNHGEVGKNTKQILTSKITTKAMISGSEYDVINTNFIRISDHDAQATGYTQTADMTSALVYNEFLTAQDTTTNPTGGSSASYTDSQVYYIVVWLTETGTNQTITTPASRENFFTGTVKFTSAQGSEVTATFSDYTSVRPDTLPTT